MTTNQQDPTTPETKNQPKPKKVPGPLRTEAIVPITIILVATYAYFHFAFDFQLKKAIEWGGTYVHGAEVNVSELKTSFWGGSFLLRGLEVTDKEQPAKNLIKIGEIRFAFLWDALLRAKFVVSDAGIDGIEIYSPRKKAGWVKPPEPPSPKASMLAQIESKVLSQTGTGGKANLDKVSEMIEGSGGEDVLKNLKADLKSEARIKELEAELKEKEKAWKERIDKLPQKEEFNALVERAKALKFNTKDPKGFASDLKELSKIKKEADEKIDGFKSMTKDLKADVEKYNAAFKGIDDLVKEDMKMLESQLKLPSLDSDDLSKSIYGSLIGTKLASVQKYMRLAREFMPPPKSAADKANDKLIPPARGSGKTYKFKITKGYPLFWLKSSSISSEPTSEGFAGRLKGSLTNVTSDPAFIGQPAILDVMGDFPKSDIQDARLKLTIDHVKEARESLELTVGHYPLPEQKLIRGDSVSLGFKKAAGSSKLSAMLHEEAVQFQLNNEFKKIDYDLNAKSKTVNEALTSILAGIPVITLNASVGGTWANLDMHLNSNLGSELSAGLKKYVQTKIDEVRAKIQDTIDTKIKPQKEKLKNEFEKIKGQTNSTIQSRSKELESAKNDVQKSGSSGSGKSNDKKEMLKEKGLKLLKGIKF
jgi:uncharacterized protein (TIGR03545 family)